MRRVAGHRLALHGLALTMMALACAKNPATGERKLNLVPRSQEIAIGKEAAQEVAQTIGIYHHGDLDKYVRDIGARLVATAERKNLPWTFQVVDDATVNAFALPGGYIFVTRGILAHMNNEAQLASVMGHEIGHVTAQHSVNRISKAQLAQVGLGLGMLLSEDVRRLGQLGSIGLSLLFLKFSRDDEREADELGLRYALRGGYDIREMPAMFAVLDRVSAATGSGGRLPSWLATHPDPKDRIAKTQKRIARIDLSKTRMTVDSDEYLRSIDGMIFGVDPRQGFFEGDRFLHPELKFAVLFPSGWSRTNLKEAVVAVSPGQDAAVQITLTKAASPEEALRAFSSRQNVRATPVDGGLASGLPSASARFTAITDEGELGGLVTFVRHQGRAFQILSLTAADKLPSYSQVFTQTHTAFAPLTDPKSLAVQPARLRLQTVSRPMTLAQLHQERGAAVPIDTIALLNQIESGTTLQPGRLVKWVQGTPPKTSEPVATSRAIVSRGRQAHE